MHQSHESFRIKSIKLIKVLQWKTDLGLELSLFVISDFQYVVIAELDFLVFSKFLKRIESLMLKFLFVYQLTQGTHGRSRTSSRVYDRRSRSALRHDSLPRIKFVLYIFIGMLHFSKGGGLDVETNRDRDRERPTCRD